MKARGTSALILALMLGIGLGLASLTAASIARGSASARGATGPPALPQQPSIVMEKTVGFVPNVCAPTASLVVPEGATVYYCYTVTNNGGITLTLHDLEDSALETILYNHSHSLAPQETYHWIDEAVITQTTINTAVWTAYNLDEEGFPIQAAAYTDTATVTLAPDIRVQPGSMISLQAEGHVVTRTITISNQGDLPLEWSFGERAPAQPVEPTAARPGIPNGDRGPGPAAPLNPTGLSEQLFQLPVGASIPTDLALGVEYAAGSYWVTIAGVNDPSEQNELIQLDENGTVITRYLQSNFSLWGWRDLAFDGTYLYASDSDEIVRIDPNDGSISGTIQSPVDPARALAYDPETDHFWTANFVSDLYRIDAKSGEVTTITNDLGLNFYGLAWDSWSPGGPYLWAWTLNGPDANREVMATRLDPATGQPTGVSFLGVRLGPPGLPPDDNPNFAGGADIRPGVAPGTVALLGMHQAMTDTVVAYDLAVCLDDLPWALSAPPAGSTPPGGSSPAEVGFDARELGTGTYHGSMCVSSNDPDDGVVTLPLTLTVRPGADLALTLTDFPDPVAPGKSLAYRLTVINHGPAVATGVTLTDTLPTSVSIESMSSSAGNCTAQEKKLTCALGDLAVGESAMVSVEAIAPDNLGAVLETEAHVSSAGEVDMYPEDNTASVETVVDFTRVYMPLWVWETNGP